jgi:hypothetical protein
VLIGVTLLVRFFLEFLIITVIYGPSLFSIVPLSFD